MPDAVRALVGFGALVLVCAAVLAVTAAATRDEIDANRHRQFAETLSALVGRAVSPTDLVWVAGRAGLCGGGTLLRGEAAGYAGAIRWLAAADGQPPALRRVHIIGHQETPGIADFLDRPDDGWLGGLHGLDAAALAAVDTVSGATITSRALRRDLAAALVAPVPAAGDCAS
ncbi:MAG: FMN-binding protein [Pseudomonadales bacterium]